jgi:hypothetical protein
MGVGKRDTYLKVKDKLLFGRHRRRDYDFIIVMREKNKNYIFIF